MSVQAPIKHPDCFFIDGKWAKPSSSAKINVLNSGTPRYSPTMSTARTRPRQLRSRTVGHNSFHTDFSIAFGFKQSGIRREGGKEGLLPFLETKTVILDDMPSTAGRVI